MPIRNKTKTTAKQSKKVIRRCDQMATTSTITLTDLFMEIIRPSRPTTPQHGAPPNVPEVDPRDLTCAR